MILLNFIGPFVMATANSVRLFSVRTVIRLEMRPPEAWSPNGKSAWSEEWKVRVLGEDQY